MMMMMMLMLLIVREDFITYPHTGKKHSSVISAMIRLRLEYN